MEDFNKELKDINSRIKRRSIFMMLLIFLAFLLSVLLIIENYYPQKNLQVELQVEHNQ